MNDSMKGIPAHLKVTKVAVLLDKSVRWVSDRIKDGTLKGRRLGNEVVIEVESLNAYLKKTELPTRTHLPATTE